VDAIDSNRGRIARASLWVLLALAVPYALMMGATGVFFGLWNAPDPRLTVVWIFLVTSPLWLALMLVHARRNPRTSNPAAIFSWITAGLLLAYVYR
jgi:heme A synthase